MSSKVVIMHYAWNTRKCTSFIVLPNGETLFNRQLRLFREAGLHDFIIVAALEDIDSLREQSRLPYLCNCNFEFIGVDRGVASAQAFYAIDELVRGYDIIFSYANLIFDAALIGAFLKYDYERYILVDKGADSSPFKARLGTKNILKMGYGLSGVGCFSAFPLIRMDQQGTEEWLNAIEANLAQNGNCSSCEEILAGIVGSLNLKAFLLEDHFAGACCGTEDIDRAVLLELRQRALLEQKIIQEKSAILDVPKCMARLGVKRLLLICDKQYHTLPVKTILTYYDIFTVPFCIEGPAEYKQLQEAVRLFHESNLDGVISVGPENVINAGKCIQLMCADGYTEKALGEPFYSSISHIAVPTSAPWDTALTPDAICHKDGLNILIQQDSILPDAVIIDRNIVDTESDGGKDKTEAIRKENPRKKRTSFKSKIKALIKRILKLFPKVYQGCAFIYKRLLFFFYRWRYAIDNQMIVFDSFCRKQYSGNPKALYEQMLQDKQYESFTFVWAFHQPDKFRFLEQNPNTRIVKYRSSAYLKAAARAKYLVSNWRLDQIFLPRKEQVYINTWHGKPIKRIGADLQFTNARGTGAQEFKRIFTKDARRITYLLSPSPAFTKNMQSAFNLFQLHKENIVVETGYPRNDFLFRYTPEDVFRTKMDLHIPLDKRIILYAPTWRPKRYEKGVGYIYNNSVIDFKQLKSELPDDCVLLFRAHNLEARSVDISALSDFVYDVTEYPDVNDLYIISDLMISDYSGTIFDYANLKRPMVLYQYDRSEYINELAGVYIDLDELPGVVVQKASDLAQAIIEQLDHFVYDDRYRRFNETYNSLDGADCSARILKMLIPPEAEITEKQRLEKQKRKQISNAKVKLKGFLQVTGIYRNENGKRLAAYKNKHKGERCFLIGNGPSLTIQDLEALKNEITFSCNLIYKIFDLTDWRPTYHFMTDRVYSNTVLSEIEEKITMPLFTQHKLHCSLKSPPQNMISAYAVSADIYYTHGNMLSYYLPSQATVMTFMIEMAMYMGFKEIYLLGVDCSNALSVGNNHFINDYTNEAMRVLIQRRKRNMLPGQGGTLEKFGDYISDRSFFAYNTLRNYADQHGFHIYNTTRGGYLEAFERVNFDDIIKK